MKKRWMTALALVIAAAGSSAAGTYAYLTDHDRAENEISTTENKIHIEETFQPPDRLRPGSVITKIPKVVNESSIGVYVRMSVKFSHLEAEQFCLPLEIGTHWKKKKDGYYYYDQILSPGSRTEPLFEKLVIRDGISEEELIPFDVLVYAESVQSFGMGQEEAWDLFGIGRGV